MPMGLALLQSRQDRQILSVLLGAVLSWGRGTVVGILLYFVAPHGILCIPCDFVQRSWWKEESCREADELGGAGRPTPHWQTAHGRTWALPNPVQHIVLFHSFSLVSARRIFACGSTETRGKPEMLQPPSSTWDLQEWSHLLPEQGILLLRWYRRKHGLCLVFYMGKSTWQGSVPFCLTVVKSPRVPVEQRRAAEKRHFPPHTSALSCSEVIRGADDQHSMVSSLIVRKVKSSAQATLQQIQCALLPPSVLHKEEGNSQSF